MREKDLKSIRMERQIQRKKRMKEFWDSDLGKWYMEETEKFSKLPHEEQQKILNEPDGYTDFQ